MDLTVGTLDGPSGDRLPMEIVERKGRGHPDTLCDGLAEQLSLSLCRHYRDAFGQILHHNVDKVLLRGGASDPKFGGGEILEPIEIFLAGRATAEVNGRAVPVQALAIEGSRDWLRLRLPNLDVDRHLRLHCLLRGGSPDLVDLFQRQHATGRYLANDSSIGVGHAPLSALESAVLAVERRLNSAAFKASHPAVGEDIKVIGCRRDDRLDMTVAVAFIGRALKDPTDYAAAKADVAAEAERVARSCFPGSIEVAVNAADDLARGSVYLTVSGTSAEAGDDGSAGRGNRANGLIAPYRPMTMESVAGKNPVSHVGKLYNIAAGLLAERLVSEFPEVIEAQCWLVSRIGQPVDEPHATDIKLRTRGQGLPAGMRAAVEVVARDEIRAIPRIADALAAGLIRLDGWPLRRNAEA